MTTDVSGKDAPVIIARAVRTRGLRGELVAEMLTDFPERFDKTNDLILIRADIPIGTVKLESHWLQNGRVILKLAGVDTIERAQEFVGCSFGVPETATVALDADEYYDWQLESCLVETIEGVSIGTVREVLHTGGGVPVLLIEGAEKSEHLIPLAKTICVEVDTQGKRIRVDAPEGLLDL
jgi:16S rRNA processing protein RimM